MKKKLSYKRNRLNNCETNTLKVFEILRSVLHGVNITMGSIQENYILNVIKKSGDLIFCDPPYLGRNSIYGGEGTDEAMHDRLQMLLDDCSEEWFLVHCEHSMYEEFVSRHTVTEKPFSYSQNFKGRNNSASKTKHLYIRK